MLSVRAAVDDYIESVTDERAPDGKYHPSSMFLCPRQAIYQVRGFQPSDPVDLKSKRKFYVGHRLHEIVQRAVETAKGVKEFYPEFEVDDPDGYNLAGHGDGLVIFDDDTAVVLEVKSISPFAIKKKGLPQEHHVKQVNSYAWAVKHHGVRVTDPNTGQVFELEPLGDRLLGSLIVYLDKDSLEMPEFFVPYDDAWDEEFDNIIYELEAYRADDTSWPPRLPLTQAGKKQWPCNYCPFKTRCWKLDPGYVAPEDPF